MAHQQQPDPSPAPPHGGPPPQGRGEPHDQPPPDRTPQGRGEPRDQPPPDRTLPHESAPPQGRGEPRDQPPPDRTRETTVTTAAAAPAGNPVADVRRAAAPGKPGTPRPTRRGSATAGDALSGYLRAHATAFLRGIGAPDTAPQVPAGARRIGGVLQTYAVLVDPAWAEGLRGELAWLTATLGREPHYSGRLARLLDALRRLSAEVGTQGAPPALALGAAKAAALLERQLTLARTRAHSATLQAMGSSRFHAVADSIAVLASEVPLTPAAKGPASVVLAPLAAQAYERLADAAAALPLHRAAHPYNAEAVHASLGAELAADLQDAPWHHVRVLLRLSRYAAEVPGAEGEGYDRRRLAEAAALLQRHREAAECAAAVAAAARTPRIMPATAYALGVLHADQRHEVEAARFAFSRLWQTHTVPGVNA